MLFLILIANYFITGSSEALMGLVYLVGGLLAASMIIGIVFAIWGALSELKQGVVIVACMAAIAISLVYCLFFSQPQRYDNPLMEREYHDQNGRF